MNILRVAQKVYPEVAGGAPYHVHALSRDQAAMGHDVTVLTVRQDATQPHLEERDGYTILRYDPTVTVLRNGISAGAASFLRDADGFDLIHAHSHLYFSTNLAAWFARRHGIPLAITNHGLFSQSASRALQSMYLKSAGKWTFNQAETVFCYTPESKRRLRGYGISSDITVVSNGIDPTRFTPTGRQSELVQRDGPTILSVTRLAPGKRPRDAIDAVDDLRADHPRIHLYVAGDGELREELSSYIASKSLDDHVTLLGLVAYEKLPSVYRSADVFLLPTAEEAGAPRVVLEAMASRLPFVMTEMEQTSHRLNETGLTAPVGEPSELAGRVHRLLSDESLRRAIGEQGRALVKEEFNWEKTVRETTEQLERVSNGTASFNERDSYGPAIES